MDHSYRNAQNGNGGGQFRGGALTPQFFQHPEIEPLPTREDATTRIFAYVDDLFFQTKIKDTARKLNVSVEFVKTDQDVLGRVEQNPEQPPSLVIFDLNNLNAKPLVTIPKLRSKLKKNTTSILGFVSHVQGDLKVKAQEAGCDAVMPRSAFSQNLPQILRRHGAGDDLEEQAQ
jgi:PleD family two-component response regulator